MSNVNHSKAIELSDCAEGYTQILDGQCYNPITKLSYKNSDFYYEGHYCGKDCDYDGRNCKEGICNVSDCMDGYNEFLLTSYRTSTYPSDLTTRNFDTIFIDVFKHYTNISNSILTIPSCYNPNLDLAYIKENKYGRETTFFSKENQICGINCNKEGRKCKTGLCNVKDCPKGYNYYEGACRNEKTGKILVYVRKNKLIKYVTPKNIETTENIKNTMNVGIIIGGLVIAIPVVLFLAPFF